MLKLNRSLLAAAACAGLCLAVAVSLRAAPAAPADMDRDLLEVTIPQLQQFYAAGKYTERKRKIRKNQEKIKIFTTKRN